MQGNAVNSAPDQEVLQDILFSQGFGSRHECAGLILGGEVMVGDEVVQDPKARFVPEGLRINVAGLSWDVREQALVMLHKPAGFECSLKPSAWPSVMTLLPPPLRRRGVQPVGRLDQDTTGLLLFTDDGTLLHKLTSPKHQVPKIYEVSSKHPVDEKQCQRLVEGVLLHDEHQTIKADSALKTGDTALRLTITSGKYHQVKRMVAAAGNRVEALHRSGVGRLRLPPDLAPGQWCWVDREAVL